MHWLHIDGQDPSYKPLPPPVHELELLVSVEYDVVTAYQEFASVTQKASPTPPVFCVST